MAGTLFVVATPIGNLEDITLRALRTLREVSAVASEDTRTTKKLLARHGIEKPLLAIYGRSGRGVLERLRRGESVALVSESGTPGVSDPGAEIVREALASDIPVRAVPGPSALAAAASVSGLPSDRFVFEGFLPKKPGKRRRALEALAREERTLVFYESPHRLRETLAAMRDALGDRRLAICRELTKVHEEVRFTTVSGALSDLDTHPPRGEYVLVLEGAPRRRSGGRRRESGEEE